MKVICISGKCNSGKDTVGIMLRDAYVKYGKRVLITHFADLVKYICKTFFGWDGVKDEKGRQLLQEVGTEKIRSKNPDYWVNFVIDMLKLVQDDYDYIIIPDCRFPNEILGIKQAEFQATLVRVVNPNVKSTLTEEQQRHSSETALDNYRFDYEFINDGTLEDLRERIGTYVGYGEKGKVVC